MYFFQQKRIFFKIVELKKNFINIETHCAVLKITKLHQNVIITCTYYKKSIEIKIYVLTFF